MSAQRGELRTPPAPPPLSKPALRRHGTPLPNAYTGPPASPSNRGADQLLPAERGARYRHRPPPAHSAGRGRGVGTVSSSRRRARYGRDGQQKAGGGRYRSCGVRRKFAAALGGFHAAALPPTTTTPRVGGCGVREGGSVGPLRRLLTAPCGARWVTHPRGFATGRGLGNYTGLAGVGAGGGESISCVLSAAVSAFS